MRECSGKGELGSISRGREPMMLSEGVGRMIGAVVAAH